ncbi:MAG TPA: RHS repeat-associated core domain-containing protein, partial [Polyangiaceae bacterium]
DETSIAYAYDAAPDCERCTNAEGQLARVSYPTSPDGAERGEDVVGYDARGQAIYSRRSMDGHVFELEKELDNAGRIVGRSYPTGHFVEFELDGAGRLLGVPGHIERVNYEDRGPVRRVTLANGVVSDYRYDALSRLTALQTTGRRENVQDYAVARDRVGNVVAVVDETDAGDAPSLDAEHDYDDWYRLLESRLDIDLPAEETLEFRYDDLDNVVSKTSNLDDSPDHVGDYVYGEDGAGPHAVTTAGELGLGYDSAGNLKSRGDDEYAWDFLGRLTEVRRGDGSLGAFVYGPARDRIKKDEDGHFTYYVAPDFEVRDGSGIVYVSLGDQKVVKIEAPEYATTMFADLAPGDATGDVYTPDPDGAIDAGDAWVAQAVLSGTFAADDLPAVTDALVDELLAATTRRLLGVQTETITYLHHDQLGSTVATTDADGNVIERSLQYPFGLPRFESGGLPEDYGHSGKERDASGLTSFGARYQDPWLARWVSVDPLFASLDAKAAGSPEATVAYAFAQNAPISLKDPLGLDAYLIAGGPSIGDPDHDKSGWNFVSAAALRVKNLKDTGYKEPVHVIVYAPNYEKRAKAEGKPEAYYLDRVKNYSAAKYGYDVTFIRSHDELTTMLKGTKPGQIDRLEYFGHSAGRDMLLEYGGTTVGSSGDNWGIADAKKIDANRFEKGAEFISWGCFQGEPGGLVQELTKHFGIRGVGAEGKTDFQPIGQGIWKPSGTYKTYESGKLQP